jgi:hypothetical protein
MVLVCISQNPFYLIRIIAPNWQYNADDVALVNTLRRRLYYDLVILTKDPAPRLSHLCASKTHIRDFEKKKTNTPSRTFVARLCARLNCFWRLQQAPPIAPAQSDACFEKRAKSSPTASLSDTPRNTCDDSFALRSKFPAVLRRSLIGGILLPVRQN